MESEVNTWSKYVSKQTNVRNDITLSSAWIESLEGQTAL